ncbi:MAG: hypothetical protein II776_06995 [Clostridia bacterium]|nr:hypothetical protein [Clostridia bacterium]
MKRAITLILILAVTLAACAGGGSLAETEEPVDGTNTLAVDPEPVELTEEVRSVARPLAGVPDYSLPEGASADEIRAMAVKAFRDALTVPWYSEKDFTYTLSSGQEMNVKSAETYAGIPYTNAGSGLLQWLQYYDFATGKMAGLGSDLNGRLGNSCAAGVMWGWSPVVTSINWNTTYLMTPGRGCLPVGGYKIDMGLMDYRTFPTTRVVEQNGTDAIVKAYMAVQPADALISFMDETSAHAQMVIETPRVVYAADGSVDLEKSTVAIQDQHKGLTKTAEPFVQEVDGERLHFAGRTRHEMTFADLLERCYIPVTAAEFIGQKPYTVPSAQAVLSGDVQGPDDLDKIAVTSPYKIVTVTVSVHRDGETLVGGKKILGRREIESSAAYNFPLSGLSLAPGFQRKLEKGASYDMTIDVLLASGTTHTVYSAPFTAN